MIFSIADHIDQIKKGSKTQTRRPTNRYKEGKLYAIQPGKGEKGISEGKIYISRVVEEWKPDPSEIPEHGFLARAILSLEAGYPIHERDAIEEGDYTSDEYERLYEEMYPGWKKRYAYWFSFFDKATLDDIKSCNQMR